MTLVQNIDEAVQVIRNSWDVTPSWGIVLGSGLDAVAEAIDCEKTFSYAEIPHFVSTTATGHRGQLLCGKLAGIPVVAMRGRFHLYEGHSARQVTIPVRVMQALGIGGLIVSNAVGGLNPQLAVGDVMVIDDHINFLSHNPLTGSNNDQLGPRFPDMSCPYDGPLAERALAIARDENFSCQRGVYIAMLGPNYETRAEIKMLRTLGGDVVGMSTVPEVLVAAHAGLRVLGLSTVTNVCSPDCPITTSGEEVVAAAHRVQEKLRKLVMGIVQ
ncbi:MAG: purine-nucleoside phosphorylase [Pirellulales bacterium]